MLVYAAIWMDAFSEYSAVGFETCNQGLCRHMIERNDLHFYLHYYFNFPMHVAD